MRVRVTELRKARLGRRFVVVLEGEPWLTLEASTLRALGITAGADVDPEEIEARSAPLEAACAWERALTMLDFAAKSRREVEIDLKRRGYREEAVVYALEALERSSFLDDEALARGAVEHGTGKLSQRAMRQRLRARGIDSETLDEVMEAYGEDDELDAARREARKRMANREATPELARKTLDALARKGFAFAVAREAIRQITDKEPDAWETYPEEDA